MGRGYLSERRITKRITTFASDCDCDVIGRIIIVNWKESECFLGGNFAFFGLTIESNSRQASTSKDSLNLRRADPDHQHTIVQLVADVDAIP